MYASKFKFVKLAAGAPIAHANAAAPMIIPFFTAYHLV